MAKIEIIKGDITRLHIDAIVNAANNSLTGGGGVDGAIHIAAGPELLRSCKLLEGCETGDAKITKGFNLPAKFVIHTVGPVWQEGKTNENQLLASCYKESLMLAVRNNIRTLAFPNISTGIYGYPKPQAATIAFETIQAFLINHQQIDRVICCCFDEENLKIYRELYDKGIVAVRVFSPLAIETTSKLAEKIWHEHYVPMIGIEQVSYMVNSFQSVKAIGNQINNENYQYYIIYHQSEPAGYIAIKPMGEELFLSKFYIIQEKRGTGLGKKGYDFISKKAKEFGCKSITLTVNKNNINSIKAYRKFGFEIENPVITDIGSGFIMDDYKMRSRLDTD